MQWIFKASKQRVVDVSKGGGLHALMKRLHAPVYASRLQKLVGRIMPHLREGDRVLEVTASVGDEQVNAWFRHTPPSQKKDHGHGSQDS